jgi:hypothetical protein
MLSSRPLMPLEPVRGFASPGQRLDPLLIDSACGGLRTPGAGVDVLYEKRITQTLFNGDWKGQRLSEADYKQRLERPRSSTVACSITSKPASARRGDGRAGHSLRLSRMAMDARNVDRFCR